MTPMQRAAATVALKVEELQARVVDLGETRIPMLKVQKAPLVAAAALELLQAFRELADRQVAAIEELQAFARGRIQGEDLKEDLEEGARG